MGLNESYAQVWGQILLLDPIPPINKVFSVISQEERQRTITPSYGLGSTGSDNSLAFAFKRQGFGANVLSLRNNKG